MTATGAISYYEVGFFYTGVKAELEGRTVYSSLEYIKQILNHILADPL